MFDSDTPLGMRVILSAGATLVIAMIITLCTILVEVELSPLFIISSSFAVVVAISVYLQFKE